MKKILAVLLILALCVLPIVSYASSEAHIEELQFSAGYLSGAVSAQGGRYYAICTFYLPGNAYLMAAVPVWADGTFEMYIAGAACECVTVQIKNTMSLYSGTVYDAAMLLP